MTEEPGNPSKADLEQEKLRLEVAELKRPAWRRASTLASFLPSLTVVVLGALLGAGVGWWTGFFDIQRLALEAQRHNLEARTQVLVREEQGLKDRKSGLQAQVSQLEGQVKEAEAALATERTRAAAERESLRGKLAADLRDERVKADKDKAALKRTVDETREAARRTPVEVWVGVLKQNSDGSQREAAEQAADELLRALKSDLTLVQFAVAEYKRNATDNSVSATLLRVIYEATGDARWLGILAGKLSEPLQAPPRSSGGMIRRSLSLTENPYWYQAALLRLRKPDLGFLEHALTLASSAKGDFQDRRGAVVSLASGFDGDFSPRTFSTEEAYFSLLRLVRDLALEEEDALPSVRIGPWSWAVRIQALRALGRFSAEGALTLFVLRMRAVGKRIGSVRGFDIGASSAPSAVSELAMLDSDFRERLGDKVFRAEAERLGVAEAATELGWEKWIRSHPELIADWTEPDLGRVRQRLLLKRS